MPGAGSAADLQTVHWINTDPGCKDYSSPLTRPEGWKQAGEEVVQLVSMTHTRTHTQYYANRLYTCCYLWRGKSNKPVCVGCVCGVCVCVCVVGGEWDGVTQDFERTIGWPSGQCPLGHLRRQHENMLERTHTTCCFLQACIWCNGDGVILQPHITEIYHIAEANKTSMATWLASLEL